MLLFMLIPPQSVWISVVAVAGTLAAGFAGVAGVGVGVDCWLLLLLRLSSLAVAAVVVATYRQF